MGLMIGTTGLVACAMRRLRRFAGDARGNVAMMVALLTPVLLMMTLGGVDIHRLSTVRMNLQDALDAATLAAARSPYVTSEDLTRVGWNTLQANLAAYPDVTAQLENVTFTLVNEEIIVADATVDVDTLAAHIALPPYGPMMDRTVPVAAHSEVNRATKDIEVSLVLDITGSMDVGSRMEDLQSAANDLVDLVVQDEQAINSTRMALVPYSMGVNAGAHLTAVRGGTRDATNISGASWMVSGGEKTIGAINKANPGRFTASSHGYSTGDFVWVSGVTDDDGAGNDLAGLVNGKAFRVVRIDGNAFSLERWTGSAWSPLSTSGYETYTANSGKARRCHIVTCEVVVTSASHGLATGEDIRILNVRGMTQINTQNRVDHDTGNTTPFHHTVTRLTDSTFALNGWVGPNRTLSNYTNSGSVQCLEYGCQRFLFTNNSNQRRIYEATSCVSERTGAQAYTDAAAASHPVSFIYTGTTNVGQGGCMTTTFTPLTSVKDTLHNAIDNYTPEGGTAGQIGIGWGWYMVSPTFAPAVAGDTPPAAYGTRNLIKVVVIMTDGEFNAVYYDGVRARDSGVGGGANDRWINHDSANGNPFRQSARMCDAMKGEDILIYTVGFDISEQNDPTPTKGGVDTVDTAQDVMEYCASNPSYVYLPQNGSSLKTAFAAIGRSISRLRISR